MILHTLKNGSFSGILTHFDLQPELKLVLSHVLPHPLPDPIPPAKKQFIVLPNEISSIQAAQISLSQHAPQAGHTTPSTFRTDTAISAQTPSAQRPLEKWQPDTAPTSAGMSGTLETTGGHWDQFAVNERMFGVTSSYREEIYTTKLDRSHPEFERRLKEADSIAREIEGKVSLNPHLAEERGQAVDDSGIDEEDKYAGVIRGSVSQAPSQPPVLGYAAAAAGGLKYTPPGKRAAAAAGVAGDPSIISSKLRTTTDSEKPATEAKPALPLPPTATPSASSPVSSTTPAPSAPSIAPQIPAPAPTHNTTMTTANGTAITATTTTTTTKDEPPPVAPIVTPQIQDLGQKFLKEEKVKIKRARNLIGTKEKQRQFAEFAEFSNSLTLNMPVPQDLLPILAGKDPAKQKALVEKNQELKRRAEEKAAAEKAKSGSGSPSTGVASVRTKSPVVAGAGGFAAGGLAERLNAIQNRGPGQIVSPVASPTPLEPGTVKPLVTNVVSTSGSPSAPPSAPKKLDPGAKEFVFKVTAKEFKPSSYASPLSTHSPSPSRSSVVSPTPGRGGRIEEKPGFFGSPKAASTTDTSKENDSSPDFHKESGQSERLAIPMPYVTPPTWPFGETPQEPSAKGYIEIFTEGKSLPPTPTSGGQDDHSPSGHSYSRSSSVHPHHSAPHPPQPVPAAPQVVQGYPTGHPGLYPPMGAMPQFGYIVPNPQLHPQQAAVTAPAAFNPQLIPGPFPGVAAQHAPQNAGPYGPQFQRQTTGGYQSISPSPLMQSAIPAQFPPQQPFANGQFPGQGYPAGPAMYSAMPPYAFVPQPQGQQANGGFSGHPSPGRAPQAMIYQPMNMQPQMYPGSISIPPLVGISFLLHVHVCFLCCFAADDFRHASSIPTPIANVASNASATSHSTSPRTIPYLPKS